MLIRSSKSVGSHLGLLLAFIFYTSAGVVLYEEEANLNIGQLLRTIKNAKKIR